LCQDPDRWQAGRGREVGQSALEADSSQWKENRERREGEKGMNHGKKRGKKRGGK